MEKGLENKNDVQAPPNPSLGSQFCMSLWQWDAAVFWRKTTSCFSSSGCLMHGRPHPVILHCHVQ
jgi:hypothetical protein